MRLQHAAQRIIQHKSQRRATQEIDRGLLPETCSARGSVVWRIRYRISGEKA